MNRITTLILTLVLGLLTAPLWANPRPQKLESIDISDYRRVTGSPGKAFYFLKKRGGFEVKSFAENTSFVRTLANSRKLQTSPNGSYYAVISYNNFRPTALRVTGIELFDVTGTKIWSNKDPDCSAFTLTDAAPIVVGLTRAEGLAESELKFFDTTGKLKTSVRVDHVSKISFSPDGRFLFAIAGDNALLKFTSGGQLLEEYPACSQYRVSNDGALVGVLQDEVVKVYKRDSVLVERKITTGTFRDLRFSADDKKAALLTSESLELIDIQRGLTNWRWETFADGYRLVDLAVDDTFTRFLCSSSNSADRPEVRDSRGRVYMLNAEGNPVWDYEMSYSERNVGHPMVKFDSRTALLSIISSEKLELFAF